MGDSLDSIERIESWTTEQRVKRSQKSAPEKDKQFSSVLRDEMEEEHRRKRRQKEEESKEPPQDEVILESTAQEKDDGETDTPDDKTDDRAESDSPGDTEPPSHIDLKA